MPTLGHRYWEARTGPSRRRKYPVLRGDGQADVVVVGGGLTGCVTASVLAAGGLDVVLVEAERLATGATAGGLGVIAPVPDAPYRGVDAAVGRRVARTGWKEIRRSAREFVTAIRKHRIACDLTPAPLVTSARWPDDVAELRKEQAARKAAGLDAPWLAAPAARVELGTESSGAIRLPDAATYDPVRAALGFAKAAVARGARVFERSPVKRITFTRHDATLVLERGTVRTDGVVIATGTTGRLASQLGRHVRRATGYAVVTKPLTAPMRRETGARRAVMVETGEAPYRVRWLPDHRALIAGAPSRPPLARQRDKILVQRTGQLMYELAVRYPSIAGLPAEWGWDAPLVTTADGLPWIGPHRNYPFHFFALGFGWQGDALAWLAARAALRHFRDEARHEDAVFSFTQKGRSSG